MKFSRLVWGVTWGSVIVLSTGALVYTFNPQPEPPAHYYGMMTVQRGQHLSLHVSNTKMAVNTLRADQSMCTAELRFVDACGNTLARRTARLGPRQSTSLNVMVPPIDPELPPDPCADSPGEIGGVAGDPAGEFDPTVGEWNPPDWSKPVRAQVVFSGLSAHCVSSVEVGDPFVGDPTGLRSGGSGFIHPGLIVGFNPQPDPPGAPTKTLR